MFELMQLKPNLICLGYQFLTLEAAIRNAEWLHEQFGICTEYNVETYIDQKREVVFQKRKIRPLV